MPQISSTTWCEIQTFGFVNANIFLIKIGDVKLRERGESEDGRRNQRRTVASLRVYSADQLAQFGAPQGLTRLIALETFSKQIVKTGGYQQLAQISERESSRELYSIRHRQNKKARYSY
ncbi:hypothetical protein pdam_00009932 [Pocillopora damicornis]|uniref:Uncharacterized protein n=1 Tax=Pocillopora damicornis TaxID=46731 RepID=A0A3M6UTA2_POCDA|nr:hypothetical protein pdam_00009932 [Pocillopora damicornis]